MNALPALILDFVVAVLLVATIGFAISLNRRLAVLRDDSGRLEELIAGLQNASARAETAVATLRAAAETAGRQLEEKIVLAESLRSDLVFVSERGDQIADRLEAGIFSSRDRPGGPNPSSDSPSPTPRPAVAPTARPADNLEKSNQSRLASLLKQAAGNPPAPTASNVIVPPAEEEREAGIAETLLNSSEDHDAGLPRSRSERDLLNALQGRK